MKKTLSILLAAATSMEWEPTRTFLREKADHFGGEFYQFGPLHIQLLETGPGIPDSTYRLTKVLNQTERPDLVVHAGIAGAFDRSVALGTVFTVGADRFADLGAQTADDGFLDLFELGLADSNQLPYQNAQLRPIAPDVPLPYLSVASAITVNTVSGAETRISWLHDRYPVDLESMEGAAVFYVCNREEVPALALRAVSNYVEPRNREAWEMGLAIRNLNDALCQWLQELCLWVGDH